jgi:ribose transport system permease protein
VGAYAPADLGFSATGMLYAGYIGNASHTAGAEHLMTGIAAVVVAGTPFTGGRASAIATGVASVFMTQLGQMVLSVGATAATQLFVQAAAIVLATSLRTAHLGSVFHWALARA